MTDRRPDCVYALLVREGRVFVRAMDGHFGLPGGVFRPMAEDRKVELKAHLWDQLGIEATAVWAQGAFEYRNPDEDREKFCGFYSVWEWTGDVPPVRRPVAQLRRNGDDRGARPRCASCCSACCKRRR